MSNAVTGGRAEIMGCEIDALDMDASVARCEELIRGEGFSQHMAINVAKLVGLNRDAELAQIVAESALVNADGQGVVWASRLLGRPLPERVAGIDLMHRLLALSAERGYRVYVLGAEREVLERAVGLLREEYPALEFAGWHDGWFSAGETEAVCDEIRGCAPDILFVAMSTPGKEQFLATHGPGLGVPFAMGVGGAIDVVAGVTKRAPRAWQRAGLEWLYRLLQEPRRMFRRYARTNAAFAVMLVRELVR